MPPDVPNPAPQPRDRPLAGQRVLCPPSRIDLNPLGTMLARKGAEVVSFPPLASTPVDPALLDRALVSLRQRTLLIIAGRASAEQVLARLERLGGLPGASWPTRVAAIGHGAVKALRAAGRDATIRPRNHDAEGVTKALGPLRDVPVLLVREAHATDALPKMLAARGALVTSIVGHRVIPAATPSDLRAAFARRIDLVALANPATVRMLVDALRAVGATPETCLSGGVIAAVGPATARAAAARGIPADLVAGGRLRRLLDALCALASAPAESGPPA